LILAGPNGAGKTTFAREFVLKELKIKRFVNADLIATGLSPFNPNLVAFSAGKIMLQEIDSLVKSKESFVFETTLSGKNYAPKIRHWKKIGYTVSLIFLQLASAELAIQRVKNRVKQGGHDVPNSVIVRRYISGINNFRNVYKDLVDDWAVFDNTNETPILMEHK
jgi:predicted ABC-type ATPase